MDKLVDCVKLALLFHSGGGWTREMHREWIRITGVNEVTSKSMCDHLRRVLEEVQQ